MSDKYKGVHQRPSGSWYYRIKKVLVKGQEPYICQESGFKSEEEANKAKLEKIKALQNKFSNTNTTNTINNITFEEVFENFLHTCKSNASKQRYQALYNAQLKRWANRDIQTISESEIDVLLMKLALKKQGNGKPYTADYQSAIRKLIRLIFNYAYKSGSPIPANFAQNLFTQPYKLRVLSLFSGIGAVEQALKNLGIDYELVGFSEIDPKAINAYCLFHSKEGENLISKNLGDISKINNEILSHKISNTDLLQFSFPCTDISKLGSQRGLSDKKPTLEDVYNGKTGELTRSGLFFEALRIALKKKPKLMLAENVAALTHKTFKEDYENMCNLIEEAGYKLYVKTLNSKNFGVPQSRARVFMVMIRNDLDIDYQFPKPIPLEVWAEDWFEDEVSSEYYFTPQKINTLMEYKSHKPKFNRDIISCITTKWGAFYDSGQTFVQDEKGTRLLTGEEMMKFQGFPPEYGTLLKEQGYANHQIGKLVGNSITVPVVQAVLKNLIDAL